MKIKIKKITECIKNIVELKKLFFYLEFLLVVKNKLTLLYSK
jgi:hypothetical protein